jgi:predicted enzyme related to lactoylglutathione lyase
MNLTVSHLFIAVTDQQKALEFYRDVLGLEVRTDASMGEYRWLTVGPKGQPELEIMLEPAGMGRSPEDAEAINALVAKGALVPVIFATDDVDEVFERLGKAGAEVLQEPIDQQYGVRDCAFRDPFGNHIRFSQPLGRS